MRYHARFLSFVVCWLLLGGLAEVTLAVSDDWERFNLEIDINSNLVNLGFLTDSSLNRLTEIIIDNKTIPEQIVSRNRIALFAPLHSQVDQSWGFFLEGVAWGRITGDSARFYRDFEDDAVTEGGAYDLESYSQKYYSAGIYHYNCFEFWQQSLIARQRFFLIDNYQELEVVGQGILRINSSQTKEGELHAIYRRIWQSGDNSYGYGIGWDWNTKLDFKKGGCLAFQVLNLPGYAYFPSLSYDNGRADAQQSDNSPIVVNGFIKEKAVWIKLPLITKVNLAYPLWGGTFDFSVAGVDQVVDFAVGYGRKIKAVNGFIAFNPIMDNFKLACSWSKGSLGLLCSAKDGVVKGISMEIVL